MTDRELMQQMLKELNFLDHAIAGMQFQNGAPMFRPSESRKSLIVEARAALAAPVVPDTQSQEIQRLRAHIQEAADLCQQRLDRLKLILVDSDAEISSTHPLLITRDFHLAALDEVFHARPAVPEGYKLLKDTTFEDRSWPDDFMGENGSYYNGCHNCLRQFLGHKRRVTCRSCATASEKVEKP